MKPTYTTEDIDQTIALYLTGLATREVASLVGLSPTQVAKIVRRAGVSRERMTAFNLSRKRAVPDDWSFSPLTPEKAWVLGLIYGDGSLSSHGYTVTVTSGDRDVVDRVNRMLGGNIGISNQKTCWNLNINEVLVSLVGVSSNILMRFLARLGPHTGHTRATHGRCADVFTAIENVRTCTHI